MTNISRLAVALGLLFSIISVSTHSIAQPPPPPPLPYTHYKIINAEVQGELVVGEPVTIIVVIQDMGNVASSSGTYEIYINRTPVDYRTIYLSSGGSTTVRYTHYFDSPGTYSIEIVTCSELGNCPDDIASGTIPIKDYIAPPQPPPLPSPPSNQPPWATIAAPSEVEVGETFWVEIIDYGDDQPNPLMFEYDFGDGERVRSPGAEPHSYSQPGMYTIRGRVCDPQGACSNTNSVTIRVRDSSSPPPPPLPPPDNSNRPPSVTLSCYPLNLTPNDTLSCEANASDPNGDPLTYEWFLNGQKLTNISSSSNRVYWEKPQPGSYELRVLVSDNRGLTAQASVSFTVRETQRNKPPVIQSIEYDPSRPVAGQLVHFWANAYDENGQIVAYEWNFGSPPFQAEEQAEYAWPNPGTYTVCLTVYDNDGASTRMCRDITVQQAKTLLPPRANFTFSPSSPKVGEPVYFKDQSTDPDGRVTGRGWLVNNQFFSGDPNPTLPFSTPGTHTVCLRVSDNDYLMDEKCTTITVLPADKPKQSPKPDFSVSNTNPKVGEPISFRDRSTDPNPNGRIISWRWNFGNGVTSYEQNPTYTYQTPGTYNVCLSVTNNDGLSTDICYSLTVAPQASAGKPVLKVDGGTSSKKQQGQTFQLSGSGFTPYSIVTVFVRKDGKYQQKFEQRANEKGEISWSWPTTTDCNTPIGRYELQALDEKNGESNVVIEEVLPNAACSSSTTPPASAGLISPIQGYPDPYNAPISSIYDHSGSPGAKDGIVRAFNGEEGSVGSGYCKSSKDGGRFLTGVVNYVSYSGKSLCYDGHYGIDYAISSNTVLAAASGKVVKTNTSCPNQPQDDCGMGWGNYVVIQHPNGLQTLYAHLKSVSVSENAQVFQGQEIGISGNSGKSDGPHLHFGVCRQDTGVCNTRNAAWVDPYAESLWVNSKPLSPRDKSLVRVQDRPEVFWIQNGKRYHVLGTDKVSIDIIKAMSSLPGWGWNKVQIASAESLNQFKYAGEFIALDQRSNGILVRQQGTKPVYVIEGGRPIHVRDESEFAARGFNWNDVIEVTKDIMQLLGLAEVNWQQVLPEVAQRYNHDPKLIQAIIQVESNGDPKAVSPVGARGLMQITKGTWEDTVRRLQKNWNWDEAFDPVKNMEIGCAYLDWLRKYLEKNRNKWRVPWPEIGLAAYNAGPGSVESYNFDIPPFKETQNYVKKIMEKYRDGGTSDAILLPESKTIEQAIASLVPNDPPDVANPEVVIGDVEMTKALGFYEKQQPVPNTDGKIIDDATMLRLQDLWISRRPVSSSANLTMSETRLRREWGLLARQLDRRSIEFIVLGFGVESLRVEIFNLQGQRVFAEEAPSNRLTFRGQDSRGQRLANGVYLYVVTVRNHDGTIKRSDVRKLVLQR